MANSVPRATMTRQALFTAALLAVALTLAPALGAQEESPLVNHDFEDEFAALSDDGLLQVAEGWTYWHREAAVANPPTWELVRPDFIPALDTDDVARVRQGESSQAMRSLYATFDAGLYQQVGEVEADSWLRFSAYAWVWSSVLDDPAVSEDDGNVFVQVGIDPDGGQDPNSEDIVWSEVTYEIYDGWREYVVVTQAAAEEVTVFIRALVGQPVRNTRVWFDETRLVRDAFDADVISALAVAIGPTPVPTPVPVFHIVEEGETLESIASLYETSVDALLHANGLASAALVHPGNQLIVSSLAGMMPTALPQIEASAAWYVVRAGDTFSGIADLFGIDVAALAALNRGVDVDYLVVGQALVVPAVPAPPASAQQYTVRSGDTLNDIALRFSVSIEELARANSITVTGILEVGQVLVIP